jgi:hypothetical protein
MSNAAFPDDARPAFLFERRETGTRAVSLDQTGANLPGGAGGWKLLDEFPLGVQEVVPADIDPEPVLRGLRAQGFFIWDADHVQPFGTSQ